MENIDSIDYVLLYEPCPGTATYLDEIIEKPIRIFKYVDFFKLCTFVSQRYGHNSFVFK